MYNVVKIDELEVKKFEEYRELVLFMISELINTQLIGENRDIFNIHHYVFSLNDEHFTAKQRTKVFNDMWNSLNCNFEY